jgi:hypothetical protein
MRRPEIEIQAAIAIVRNDAHDSIDDLLTRTMVVRYLEDALIRMVSAPLLPPLPKRDT